MMGRLCNDEGGSNENAYVMSAFLSNSATFYVKNRGLSR